MGRDDWLPCTLLPRCRKTMESRATTAWVSAPERRFYHVPVGERIRVEERCRGQDQNRQGRVADPGIGAAGQGVQCEQRNLPGHC